MNRYRLDENSHARKVFRILGPVLLGIGALLTLVGIIGFISGTIFLIVLAFIGMPLDFIGSVLTALGYMGAVARYTASQSAPVAKDVANYMIDNTQHSVANLAGKVAREIKTEAKPVTCLHCGEVAHPGALFCDRCGKPLAIVCPKCNEQNDQNARYCQKCGEPL